MPYKDIEKRREWARKKWAKSPHTRNLCRLRIRKQRATERGRIYRSIIKKVENAIKSKKLTRRPCEVCANPIVHAHHEDYNKPLEVRWLCIRHHIERHKEIKKTPTLTSLG